MRVVKLVIKKINSEWRAGPFLLNKNNIETNPFDFDVIDFSLQRAIRKAQSVFGLIDIVDLPDSDSRWIVPNVDNSGIEEVQLKEIIKEEPKINSLEPTKEDIDAAIDLISQPINIIKQVISSLPKDKKTKRIIMKTIELEKALPKSRKTLIAFLENSFLAIPEGE
jgi:hypothetical protein